MIVRIYPYFVTILSLIHIWVSFVGYHQVCNALMVIEVVALLRQNGFHISEEALKTGLETARFPARFEVVSEHPLTVVDGAHNEGGAKALSRTLRENISGRKMVAVIGMLKEKSYDVLLSEIGPLCAKIIAVPVGSPRALPPELLAETAVRYCPCLLYTSQWCLFGRLERLSALVTVLSVCLFLLQCCWPRVCFWRLALTHLRLFFLRC